MVQTQLNSKVEDKVDEFSCGYCIQTFPDLFHMKNHLSTVHRKKPQKCEFCEKEFLRVQYLKIHIKKYHNNIEISEITCKQCFKQFTTKSNLKHHILRVHEKVKRHECENCEMSFFTRLERKNHTKSLHTLVVTKAKKSSPQKEGICL